MLKVMDAAELGHKVMVFPLLQAASEKLPLACLPRMIPWSHSGQSQLYPVQETGSFQKGHIREEQPELAVWRRQ